MQKQTLEKTKATTYTEEQKKFIEAPIKDSIILCATAGSGKSFSAVERLKFLLDKGVDPKKIIFFSFTVAAVDELKSRIKNPDIKITTIHSFCMSILGKMGKFKKISTFYDFISWIKEKNKPKAHASLQDKEKYYNDIEKLYEDAEYLSAAISAFKLQTAEGIKCKLPDYFLEYSKFLKENKARDFSDMLIETRDSLKENKWIRMFRNQYSHIFVDEVQDTSVIQMQILLSFNADSYCLIGDPNQSIFQFSGTNYYAIESMLKNRRKVVELNLSTNFRSAKNIVEYSNKFSKLQAKSAHSHEGNVHSKIIFFDKLLELFQEKEEVVVLVRTNAVIKEIERKLLRLKIPIKYSHFITQTEIDELKKGTERIQTRKRVNSLLDVFGSTEKLVYFIQENQNKKSMIKSIHKSKGLEFDCCVIVNSLSPHIIEENKINLTEEEKKYISFDMANPEDEESQNIHYVAASRAKHENYFMVMDIKN